MAPLCLHRSGLGIGQHNVRRRVLSHASVKPGIPSPFQSFLPTAKSLDTSSPSIRLQAAAEFHAAQQDLTQVFSSTV